MQEQPVDRRPRLHTAMHSLRETNSGNIDLKWDLRRRHANQISSRPSSQPPGDLRMLKSCSEIEASPTESAKTTTEPKHKPRINLPSGIEKLPYDIHHLIFSQLTLTWGTTLALSCPVLYQSLKAYHPAPISLDTRDCFVWEEHEECTHYHRYFDILAWNIQLWRGLGDSYFLDGRVRQMFLNSKIFKARSSPKSYYLKRRYQDRYESVTFAETRGMGSEMWLPEPWGMGDEWYEEAKNKILGTREKFKSEVEWKGYWEFSDVWKRLDLGCLG